MALPYGVDFYVNENRILEPLNLVVLRDSRVDLFPRLKERVEEIPGRHGEINLGSKLEPRLLELHVAVEEKFDFLQREKKKREIAGHLNPTIGTKVLVFADEPDKQYFVKYAGVIDIDQYTNWFEFTIPFKCSDPYIYGTIEHNIPGEEVNLINSGNISCSMEIRITGNSVEPIINFGDYILKWNSNVAAGKQLVINTGKLTVTYDGDNALKYYNNVFPKLQPGNNLLTASGGGTFEFTWIERWV